MCHSNQMRSKTFSFVSLLGGFWTQVIHTGEADQNGGRREEGRALWFLNAALASFQRKLTFAVVVR